MKSNYFRTIITAIIVLLVLGGGLFWARRAQLTQAQASNDLYYCPMHPQIQSDKPGTCPICYMNLVKKEDETHEDHAQHERHSQEVLEGGHSGLQGYAPVRLSSDKQQLIGLETAPVEKGTLTKTIRTFGYVAHDLELYEAQLEYIEAWRIYYAYVVRRPVREGFDWDWRKYFLTTSTVSAWRSEDEAKAERRMLLAEYELRHQGMNDEQLKHLREIKYGQPYIRPDLLFFDENQPVWVYAQIFESDLGFVTVGQKVTVNIPSYNETTEGVVSYVTQMIDGKTRSVQARIELPQYRGELLTNMYVDVAIHVDLNDALLIPRQALLDMGTSKVVFVEEAPGRYAPRQIQTGFEGDGKIAVASGLKEGERIVVSGNFLLDSESRLKAAIESAGQSVSSTNATHAGH